MTGWDATRLPPDIDPSWPVPDIGISAVFAPIEYFGYDFTMPQMIVRLRVGSLADYVDRILALRTSPNGIFGCHIHWHNFVFAATAGVFQRMPRLRVIHIERTDRLAQAVSHVKALQTGQWGAGHRAAGQPAYDRDRIASSIKLIDTQNGEWRATFERSRIQPIRVTYESLCADPDGVVGELLRRFDALPDPSWRPPLPPIHRQADAVNREWIERFRRETGA